MLSLQPSRKVICVISQKDSARNTEFVKILGADQVIDYTSEDFTKINTRFNKILDPKE